MLGVGSHLVSHIVRRGVPEMSSAHGRLQTGTFEFSGFAVASLVFLAISTILVIASVDYTVGKLMVKLAMIESSTTTTIIESHPPAYTEEPDAPLEKKGLIEEADIEIVTIKHKPITTSVKTTIKHLHHVGGFRARWRGLRESIVYSTLMNVVGNIFSKYLFVGANPMVAHGLGFTVATIILCRFRMVWTHAMIAAPSNKPWYRRYCVRKGAFVLGMPTLAYVMAMHATVVTPIAAWYMLGVFDFADVDAVRHWTQAETIVNVCKVLVGPVIALLGCIFLVIPANAALTRVEACLLPADEQTIVPFDREALMADVDFTVKGAAAKLHTAAWKSVSWATRFRVFSIYAKMISIQLSVIFINAFIALTIVYLTGPEQFNMLAYTLL